MSRCNSFSGVHKFQPRYDLGAVEKCPNTDCYDPIKELPLILEKYRTKTYVKDICVKCGEDRLRN